MARAGTASGKSRAALHLSQGGTDEHLKGNPGADRVAGQPEDERSAFTQSAEGLRFAGLHRNPVEADRFVSFEECLDRVEGSDTDPAGQDQCVAATVPAKRRLELTGPVAGVVGLGQGTGVGSQHGHKQAIRVRDPAAQNRFAGSDKFIARADHRHAWPAGDDHLADASRGHGGQRFRRKLDSGR